MKRWIAMLLAILLLILPASAEEEASHDWYLKTGLALALDMCELANDEAYIKMVYGYKRDILDRIPENTDDFGEVWLARPMLSGENLIKLLGLGGEMPSETGIEYLSARIPNMLLATFNKKVSAEALAASSMATASRTFIQPTGGLEPCILAVELGDIMAGIAFMQTGEDTVTVTCQPIFLEEGQTVKSQMETLAAQLPIELIHIL